MKLKIVFESNNCLVGKVCPHKSLKMAVPAASGASGAQQETGTELKILQGLSEEMLLPLHGRNVQRHYF